MRRDWRRQAKNFGDMSNGFRPGVEIFGRRVCILLYADDIVLLAESAEVLQLMLDYACLYASQWRFRFNAKPGKSEIVIAGPSEERKGEEPTFYLGETRLSVAQEYRYLGVELGSGLWSTYLDRILARARFKMHQLWHSVKGRSPLHLATSVKLFKTLVRPTMEYAASIWGCLCSPAFLKELDRIQVTYGRLLLRVPSQAANEYVLSELGLESMEERLEIAQLNLFGRLARMPPQRLAGHIFRHRCDEVDQGGARNSWCARIKSKLVSVVAFRRVWWTREPLPAWKQRVTESCRGDFAAKSYRTMSSMSSLRLYSQLPPTSDTWLQRCLDHKGAELRFKLRAGVVPLFANIAASRYSDIEPENRICLLCETKQVEDAQHFACSCPLFEEARGECLARIVKAADGCAAPRLWKAVQDVDVSLFLSDSPLQELPPAIRHKVDSIICDFLKVAWRLREKEWAKFHIPGNPWVLG